MSSVSKVTATDAPRAGRSASGNGQSRSEGISVGVILKFPPEIAAELQRWRASFGDPMAGVIPAHITLVTTTMTQDWEATRSHVREVAARRSRSW